MLNRVAKPNRLFKMDKITLDWFRSASHFNQHNFVH